MGVETVLAAGGPFEPSAASADAALLIVRVLAGVVFAMHGAQKLWGWFGGGGLDGTASWFASLGFRHGRRAAVAAGASEVLGGLGYAAGLLTPAAAAAMVGVMTVAAIVNHAEGGFWSVRKGWELNGYLILLAAAVAVLGPGRWSLDAALGIEAGGFLVGAAALIAGLTAGFLRWVTRSGFPRA